MNQPFIELHSNDDVLIALREIPPGTDLGGDTATVETIPTGHKVARRAIPRGALVHRYNQVIGFASGEIPAGAHVHTHNLAMGDVTLDYAFCRDAEPTAQDSEQRTFLGIRRPDGRVATRNYIGVISSVNCSATACRMIGDHYRGRLGEFPNVDGVLALTHKSGCGLDHPLDGINALKRALAGYVRHPNIARVIVVGLGCEITNLGDVLDDSPVCQFADTANVLVFSYYCIIVILLDGGSGIPDRRYNIIPE